MPRSWLEFGCPQARTVGPFLSPRSGLLTRLCHGAYATSELVDALDPVDLHMLTARAVLNQQRGPVGLTGISAAAVHGLALWGQDLDVVHLVRLDRGSPRRECGVQHHVVADDVSSQIEVVNGLPVLNMARAVWEVASSSGMEVGVCTADSALHLRTDLSDELHRLADPFRHRPGSRSARMTLRFADGRAETPGESLSRVLFFRRGLPYPQLQQPVHRRDGSLIGTTDFYWEEFHHLGEFDGKLKYGRLLKPGELPGDAVFREKRREDEMRAESHGMSRWAWSDVMPQGQRALVKRLEIDLERSFAL